MNPVPRMIPAAKHFTITKRSRSGLKAGIERDTKGKLTPIMLVNNIANIDIIFSGRAFSLLLHLFEDSLSQSASAFDVKRVIKMKIIEITLCMVTELAIKWNLTSVLCSLN
jgi:hypothetical protein